MEVPRHIDIDHIHTGHHDLRGGLVVEVDDVLEELLLLRLVSLQKVDGLREVIHGEVIALGLHATRQHARRAHKEGGERIEDARDQRHLPRGEAAESEGVCLGIDLRDDLTEE